MVMREHPRIFELNGDNNSQNTVKTAIPES